MKMFDSNFNLILGGAYLKAPHRLRRCSLYSDCIIWIVGYTSLRRLPKRRGLPKQKVPLTSQVGLAHFISFRSLIHKCWSYSKAPHRLRRCCLFHSLSYPSKLGTSSNKKDQHECVGLLCPRLDSNQHAVSSTTTSRWLVYQFQHPG